MGSSAADSGLLPPLKAAVRAAHHLTIPLIAILPQPASSYLRQRVGTRGSEAALFNPLTQHTLAFIDTFWLCFWAAISSLILVSLMTWASPGPLTPGWRGRVEI